jgi:ABC-type Fe3+-siderophore transport system permease subunit
VSRSEPPGVLLLVAVIATGAETLGLAASAIGLASYKLSGHRPFDSGDLWAVVGMAAVGAIGLGLVVRGLARVRRWARSPAVLTQLIVLPIGLSTAVHGSDLVGIPLAICGLVGLVGLFAPSTMRRLNDSRD